MLFVTPYFCLLFMVRSPFSPSLMNFVTKERYPKPKLQRTEEGKISRQEPKEVIVDPRWRVEWPVVSGGSHLFQDSLEWALKNWRPRPLTTRWPPAKSRLEGDFYYGLDTIPPIEDGITESTHNLITLYVLNKKKINLQRHYTLSSSKTCIHIDTK